MNGLDQRCEFRISFQGCDEASNLTVASKNNSFVEKVKCDFVPLLAHRDDRTLSKRSDTPSRISLFPNRWIKEYPRRYRKLEYLTEELIW